MDGKEVCFWVHGSPTGKGRPRFTRAGHAYTPQKTKDYEDKVKEAFLGKGKMLSGAIAAEIIIRHEVPKSWSVKKRVAALQGEIMPTIKPDIDNIIKIIFDSLNGMAYQDDRQIIEVSIKKIYDLSSSVHVRLWELEEHEIRIGGSE